VYSNIIASDTDKYSNETQLHIVSNLFILCMLFVH